MKRDPILSLYQANESLMHAKQAFEAAGNAEAVDHCREAAISTTKAIAAAVRQRVEAGERAS